MQGNTIEWLTLVTLAVGLITVFIQIGSKQGKQEEKNKNFETVHKRQDEEIRAIKETFDIKYERQNEKIDKMMDSMQEMQSDLSYIKGKLIN